MSEWHKSRLIALVCAVAPAAACMDKAVPTAPPAVEGAPAFGLRPGKVAYSGLELGTLDGDYSQATAINDAGLVVGMSGDPTARTIMGFRWTQASGMVPIPNGPRNMFFQPAGVNNRGVIVGAFIDLAAPGGVGLRAALIEPHGEVTFLGPIDGPAQTYALAINKRDEVVGYQFNPIAGPGGDPRAFYWSRATGIVDMGELTPGGSSLAFDINDAGEAVGYAYADAGNPEFGYTVAPRAFLWTQAAGMLLLSGLADDYPYVAVMAFGINNQGDVVGARGLPGSGWFGAFRRSRRGEVAEPDLNAALPFTGVQSIAEGINDRGIAIVSVDSQEGSVPYVWFPDGETIQLPNQGETTVDVAAINAHGTAIGSVLRGPNTQAIVWSPFRQK